MSGPEIKHSLRKLEFPLCAKEALTKIGQLICGRVPSIKHMDLALDLMAEFIFCEVDRRGNKRPASLTFLLELQLLEVLYDYFNSPMNEVARNSVFLSVFSGTTAMQRSTVLSKLVSIAIGTPSPLVLTAAGVWMQQLGNTSMNSCKLAESLVKDYFILVPSAIPKLTVLPLIAPQFTANFLTAIADIYYSDNKKGTFVFPPQSLLEMITMWVTDNSKLCIAAQQIHSALPPGAIAMEAITPLAGLLKWCILAPIYNQRSSLYSRLQLSLLNNILDIPQTIPPRAICAQHLTASVGNLCRYISNFENRSQKSEDKDLQIALDRFAQAVQVALSVHCVYGNIDDLINQLEQLPENKLLQIIINNYNLKK